ncbi:ABC transporter substrate-binding protein [Actinomadura sp. HBU206391]|uniref:ABC transporter substrate-binding protein n=1 Tax=Actinomadura sp. HBU206391 TaxID=2731692 RepID=UPI0016501593|nr:ABC transporter substrate-binding protein [Actinomadura sp. HBU206391]MBC6460798.1 protein kinase [Actinomadura sp. HBU206391]
MPDSRPLRPGDPERLGGYRLIGLLGEGGQGIVYLGVADKDPSDGSAAAEDGADESGPGADESNRSNESGEPKDPGDPDRSGEPDRLFAIKLLRTHLSSDARARRYFAKEVAAAQRIEPSFTARIIEADMEGRTPYIVSEYVDGRPLSEAVRSEGPLAGPELHRLAVGTLNALIAIHQANVVHRDFKPSNVLLSADRPRVIDFGIARALDSTISVSSGVVGTPAYMAPEQLTGQQITPAADVFAWAATMVFAATGAPPFGQDSIPVVMHRILNTDPYIGDLQGPLRDLVWYCLYKHPSQRPTAQQVLAGLTASAAQSPVPGAGWGAPAAHAAPMAHPAPARPAGASPVGTPVWGTDPNVRGTDPGRPAGPTGANGPNHPNGPSGHPNLQPPHGAAPSPGWGPMGVQLTKPPRKARRTWVPVAAAAVGVALVAGLGVVALQLFRPDDKPVDPITSTRVADAGLTKVVNKSTTQGGTLRLVHNFDFDSIDPGDMYQNTSWNFSRLYARPLLTYKSVPGTEGLQPTADLATGPGEPSEDLKTWTYRLRRGVKYEDGSPVTAKDVRYAVARTFDRRVLFSGPAYFSELLAAGDYAGPYDDKDLSKFTGVTAPDDQTVVFHLKKPNADFDYLAALPQTAPVPQSKDTGADYKKRVISTGPYKVESYVADKSITLVRNPNWGDDGNRKQLVDRIEVNVDTDVNAIDNKLLNGQADLDATGSGLQATAQAKALSDTTLKANTDNPTTGFLRYVALSTKVAPFDNVHCRRAVQYAVDRTAVQTALGGRTAAEPATNLLPPVIAGRQRFDSYPTGLPKAKEELASCGKPNGFTTNLAIRQGRPKDKAQAEVLQSSLAKAGITLRIREYPVTEFFRDYAGKPDYVHKNDIGMILSVWGPDYPTGLGFFPLLIDGRNITSSNNNNLSELNDSEINGLLDQAAQTRDQKTREGVTAEIDRKVMDRAAIVPLVYDKAVLYRGSRLTNVYVSQMFGGYDYACLGVQ